jgi:hypothetical protein
MTPLDIISLCTSSSSQTHCCRSTTCHRPQTPRYRDPDCPDKQKVGMRVEGRANDRDSIRTINQSRLTLIRKNRSTQRFRIPNSSMPRPGYPVKKIAVESHGTGKRGGGGRAQRHYDDHGHRGQQDYLPTDITNVYCCPI